MNLKVKRWASSGTAVAMLLATFAARSVGDQKTSPDVVGSFTSISRAEIEMLLVNVMQTNPKLLERLAADPQLRKDQIANLRQLLAFASQAQRDGIAADPTNAQELENIRAEVTATNYDRYLSKGKASAAQFAFVTAPQIKAFWIAPGADKEFKAFLDAKIALLKQSDPTMDEGQITPDEKAQAREVFAKVRLARSEFERKKKTGLLPKSVVDKAALQVKLQQAQFLAKIFSETASDKWLATEDEIAKYIAAHPDIDPEKKRVKAQALLTRARAGEDFAKLANEFSEDPGNLNSDGTKRGGLYKDVAVGAMVKPFEEGALALKPGEVGPALIQSDFGFHIIKLERKGETYDVRHILISTGIEDPDKPGQRAVPVTDYVREILDAAKEKQYVDGIVAQNQISVPDDFTVPTAVKKAPAKRPVARKRN